MTTEYTAELVKFLADVGMNGVLLFFVFMLWQRLSQIEDKANDECLALLRDMKALLKNGSNDKEGDTQPFASIEK